MANYCTIRVKWNFGDPEDEQLDYPETFDEVVTLLSQVRDRHAVEHADSLAADPAVARSLASDVYGGFGVYVTNRWNGVVEVAPGKEAWFLFCHEPPPRRWYSDCPPIEGHRVFYLDGGHHTELAADALVSRDRCLHVLHDWLETGVFANGD
jgi:hypothetical protein